MAPSSSKKTNALVPYSGKVGTDLVNEKIDERILRMIGLEDIFDIDYDTYSSLLRERMAAARMAKTKIPTEETELITDEWKRVKGKKGRFKVTKKKITAQSIRKGSATGVNFNKQKLLTGVKPLALSPSLDKMSGKSDIQEIKDVLSEIVKNLVDQNKLARDKAEKDRLGAEDKSRSDVESGLEKKFGFVARAAEKIAAPVKGIIEKIIEFFVKLLVGRAIYKIVEWFGDKNNQSKITSIISFLKDWWPALIGAFLIFGTGLGGFVSNITGVLLRGIAALLSRNPVALGTVIGGGLLAGGATIANKKKDDAAKLEPQDQVKPEEPKKEAPQPTPVLKAAGGGLIQLLNGVKEGLTKDKNISTAIGGALGGAMFGPVGMLLGSIAGNKGGDLIGQMQGLVQGEKGVDKVPAMLSDGEFVMSRGAVKKFGLSTLEGMNAAGGGDNKPKISKGVPHAAGGGLIGTDRPNDAAGKENERTLKKQKQEEKATFGPGAMPNMSTQADMNKLANKITFEERLKRIEAQVQSQKALASGKGLNIKGAQLGTQIGKGFGATYKGRDSIVVPNAATTGWEQEITLGGKRYFGQVKGNDVVYTSHFAKGLAGQVNKYGAANKSYQGKGGGLMGGGGLNKIDPKGLPKTQVMTGPDGKVFVGHLRFRGGKPEYARPQQREKGMLENIGDFFNPGGAKKREDDLNKKSKRDAAMNSLQYYRASGMTDENIAKQMKKLGLNLTQAQNDLKYKDKRTKDKSLIRDRSGNVIGQRDSKGRDIMSKKGPSAPSKSDIIHKNNEASRAKQAPPAKPAAQIKPIKPKSAGKITPPASKTPKIVVKRSKKDTLGSGGGSTSKGSDTPKFKATAGSADRSRNKKLLGVH
jgi:hypothetical protein